MSQGSLTLPFLGGTATGVDLSGFAVSTVFNETKFEESQTLDGNVFHYFNTNKPHSFFFAEYQLY